MSDPEAMDPRFRARLQNVLIEEVRRDARVRVLRHRPRTRIRVAALGLAVSAVVVGVGVWSGSGGGTPTASPPVVSPAALGAEIGCLSESALAALSPVVGAQSTMPMTGWERDLQAAAITVHIETVDFVADEDHLRMACDVVTAPAGALTERRYADMGTTEAESESAAGDLAVEFQVGTREGDSGICLADSKLLMLPRGVKCNRVGLEVASAAVAPIDEQRDR